MIETGRVEQRRHPRMRVSWPVVLEAEGRPRYVETIDVGARGAKLRLEAAPPLGSQVFLHVLPPDGGELHVEALTWRIDLDGVAFFFMGLVAHAEEREHFIGEDAAELALV